MEGIYAIVIPWLPGNSAALKETKLKAGQAHCINCGITDLECTVI